MNRRDTPRCPHCAYPYEDAGELGLDDEEETVVDCPSCDGVYRMTAHFEVTYSIEKTTQLKEDIKEAEERVKRLQDVVLLNESMIYFDWRPFFKRLLVRTSLMSELECPHCGDVAAYSDDRGLFYDGQPITCGCSGIVSLDAESPPYVATDGPEEHDATQAQAALDALTPKETRLYVVAWEKNGFTNIEFVKDVSAAAAAENTTTSPNANVLATPLEGYVERDKIEQALAHRETLSSGINPDWVSGYRVGHKDLSERIRKAMGDE